MEKTVNGYSLLILCKRSLFLFLNLYQLYSCRLEIKKTICTIEYIISSEVIEISKINFGTRQIKKIIEVKMLLKTKRLTIFLFVKSSKLALILCSVTKVMMKQLNAMIGKVIEAESNISLSASNSMKRILSNKKIHNTPYITLDRNKTIEYAESTGIFSISIFKNNK